MDEQNIKKLKRRIIEISYRLRLSHLGSCLTALPIIYEIYQQKKEDEKFVLSAGHAHLAHAVVMEHHGIIKDAEKNIRDLGIHCDRVGGCDVSSGSLGHGLPIAVGMALSDRNKNVYALISDGECAEGSIWEAVRIKRENSLNNLKIYLNHNGFAAYRRTDPYDMPEVDRLIRTNTDHLPFLKGLDAHYHVMTDEEYLYAMKYYA